MTRTISKKPPASDMTFTLPDTPTEARFVYLSLVR